MWACDPQPVLPAKGSESGASDAKQSRAIIMAAVTLVMTFNFWSCDFSGL
jgi:hypothetical protein